MKKKLLLAYSGGLDTTYAIGYLSKQYDCDVIALLIDLGEEKNIAALEKRALQAGASSCVVIDGQDVFAKEYLSIAIQTNALYEGVYPLISALSRALISKYLVEVAHKENAFAVAHGCTAKGNDQLRFDLSIRALDASLKIIAPLREYPVSRPDAIAYMKEKNISIPITKEHPYSIDMNIWGRSCECGVLEDPWIEPPADAFALTTAPEDAPNTPQYIEITFQKGIPIALDGNHMSLRDIVVLLNEIAGKHGIGRIDHLENRVIGIKSRELYEAPGALTIMNAHKSLEGLCLTKDLYHFKMGVEMKIATMIYEGMWFSQLFQSLKAFITESQKHIDGQVRLKLYKGQAVVVGKTSPVSLYNHDLSTYNPEDTFDHSAAEGFSKLWGLPLEIYSKVYNTYKGQ